jgi:opacity protein-like surface antigen
MKLFAAALLVLGSVSMAQAQEIAPGEPSETTNVAQGFTAASVPRPSSISFMTASDPFFLPPERTVNTFGAPVVATALAVPLDPADPAAPSPKPKFLYSKDDIVRWELALGVDWVRFRSSIFNASGVGVRTSLTYFTTDWLGIEGNVSATFAPQIFDREHVKLLIYGVGPKVAWRQNTRWQPWLHVIFGGAHEQPQTAGNGKNTYSIQAGGGADYAFNSRFSGRLQANYIRTGFFSQSQNNFELGAGLVVHF